MLDFVAIDVETANSRYHSICQVGVARYLAGVLVEEWRSYVDPKQLFDPVNNAIHGLTPEIVQGAPTFKRLAPALNDWLAGAIVVCHSPFDQLALTQAYARHRLEPPTCTWLDTSRVARRAWECCAYRDYGLKSVCWMLGYSFRHHDALEDAKAAGHILLRACTQTGLDIPGWLERVEYPIDPNAPPPPSQRIARDGNPEGLLFGEVLVFTGELCMPRHIAAEMAANAGCKVAAGVTKKTTILVAGDQDIGMLRGQEKSAKHRRAEELALAGQPIRIISESDFVALVDAAP